MPTCGRCADGWTCEEHPDRPWLHDECSGPGCAFCDNPHRPYRIDQRPVQTKTGLVCPNCRERVAAIDNMMPWLIVFSCPAC